MIEKTYAPPIAHIHIRSFNFVVPECRMQSSTARKNSRQSQLPSNFALQRICARQRRRTPAVYFMQEVRAHATTLFDYLLTQ